LQPNTVELVRVGRLHCCYLDHKDRGANCTTDSLRIFLINAEFRAPDRVCHKFRPDVAHGTRAARALRSHLPRSAKGAVTGPVLVSPFSTGQMAAGANHHIGAQCASLLRCELATEPRFGGAFYLRAPEEKRL